MKTFSEFQTTSGKLKGHDTPEQISKKYNVGIKSILKQLKMGIGVEREHSINKDIDTDLALHHLGEFPDYYTRLKKLEFQAKKKLNKDLTKKKDKLEEQYTTIQSRGSTYNIILTWKGNPINIQIFFPQLKRPTRVEVKREVDKIYPGANLISFIPSYKDPTKPFLFAGDCNEPRRY